MTPKYLDRAEASAFLREKLGLKYSKNTLQKMATTGGGPTYYICGNRALYTPDDLIEWAEAKLSAPRRSTSEAKHLAVQGCA